MNTQARGKSQKSETPPYFKTVVVPIANPNSARHMLTLACDLSDAEGGKVIALTVAEPEEKDVSERVTELKDIVNQFDEQDHPVELVTQIASSVSRGILDGAREYGADALILGVHRSARRQVKLGTVVENIITAAPCNVLVYRMAESPDFDRVVVPLDNSVENIPALVTAIHLAKRRQIELAPLYIQRDYSYSRDRESVIRGLLDILPPQLIKKDIVPGRNPAENILHDIGTSDLLVIGFAQRNDFTRQIQLNVAETLLNRSPGPVLLSSQILEQRGTIMGALQRGLQRFNPALTQVERNELVWQARRSALSNIDYLVLIVMSAALASLGLLLNSVAVIIGAMLVAPLMSPLGALATGMATGQIDITQRAVISLIQGTFLAIIISYVMGAVLPPEFPTTEMLARGNPSLLDAAVALFSGLVAAFAIARKEIPAALAGVAIAAALMPPICTVGLGLALANLRLAAGAALLFTTNIVFIIVAENVIFLWIGMRPGRRQETRRAVTSWWTVIIGLMILVIALIISLSQRATISQRAETYLLQQLNNVEFVMIDVEEGEDQRLNVLFNVVASQPIPPSRVETLQEDLSAHLGREVRLSIVAQPIIQPPTDEEEFIIDYLRDALGVTRITSFEVITDEAEGIRIDATVHSPQPVTENQIAIAEDVIAQQFQQPVSMFLVVQQVITAETTPDVPEPTPQPDQEE